MNYLLDRKLKRNKFFYGSLFVIILLILIYFRAGIFRGLAYVSHTVFHPVFVLGNGIEGKFRDIGSYFYFKQSLLSQNDNLKQELNQMQSQVANYNSVLDENNQMKEIMGRKNEKTLMILAGILSRPNGSVYDTLIVDAGLNQGVVEGDMVFAYGNVPIGRVALVYTDSSNIVLFSNPGEKTEVMITGDNTSMQLVGRGGGNFEMIL